MLELILGATLLALTVGCVASSAAGGALAPPDVLSTITFGTFVGGLLALLANREVSLAVCFACSAGGAFALRSANAEARAGAELLVVEIDAAGFDPRYADALARSGADVVRLRGAVGAVAEELAETFDYGHVYAPSQGHAIGLYSCHPFTAIDTTYTAGAAVVRVSLAHTDSSVPLNLLSVAELPRPAVGIGQPATPFDCADEPTVVFSDDPPGEGFPLAAAAVTSARVGSSATAERFNRAARGIFFAGELACTSSVVLRERGIYLGRGATFRSGPPASPLAAL